MEQPHKHTTGTKNIKIAFLLNFFFTILEIVGGLYTNSIAILSDALHDLGDSLSLGLSWYLERVARKKKTKRFSYGFQRFSLLAALINSIILIIGSILILANAIPRIMMHEETFAEGMVVIALVGLVVNGIAAFKVKGGKTMNERIVTWHLIEDVLSWAAILVVSILMTFYDLFILDPILSVLITLYVLINVFRNLKETIVIFLQGVPESVHVSDIEKFIVNLPKVVSVHDTHVWSLDGEHTILTTHAVIEKNASIEDTIEVKCAVKACMGKFNVQHATIEIEQVDEKCELTECTLKE